MKTLLLSIIIVLAFGVNAFAAGPKVPEVGLYCFDKGDPSIALYRFYTSALPDPSGATPINVLSLELVDEVGDNTRTCALRDQTGEPKGQYYTAIAACNDSASCSDVSVTAPFELTFSKPTGLAIK